MADKTVNIKSRFIVFNFLILFASCASAIQMNLDCDGHFISDANPVAIKMSMQVEVSDDHSFAKVLSISADAKSKKYLKYALLPSTEPLNTQNEFNVGVDSLFDCRAKSKSVFLGFFKQNYKQFDKAIDKKTIETKWIPQSVGSIGYFEATRSLQFHEHGLSLSVQAKDYFDADAVKNSQVSYIQITGPTKNFEPYSVNLDCKNRK